MEEKKANGVTVIDVPVGETFIAENGLRYKAVPDSAIGLACIVCNFWRLTGMCWRYRCWSKDREDGKSVHFVKC